MYGREASNLDAILFIYDVNFRVIKLVTVNFCTYSRESMNTAFSIPTVRLLLVLSKVSKAIFRFIGRGSIDFKRFQTSSSPATNPYLTKITYMICVQMGGKISCDSIISINISSIYIV